MTPQFRLLSASCLFALALFGVARLASAQECVGLPGGRGLLSVGFEGTDAATGRGLSFAFRGPSAAVLLQHRSLDGFTLIDDLSTTEAQASAKIPGFRLPICLTAGAQWTAYQNDRHESSWVAGDPRYRTERHLIGGPYRRLRVPIGVAFGRELRVGDRLTLVPYVQPAVVFERESYEPENGPAESRSALGWGASGGVTAAFDWFVLRSAVSHTATHDYSLSSQNNFATLSVHAGVRF